MIDKTVKHYTISEKLGEGGMGVVYKAHDTKLDRTVALKFLPPELSASEESNRRFLNEAKAASALHHNNTCTIFEIDETEEGQLYIVMPAYDGKPLDVLIEEEGPLPIERALDIAIQIGEGLKAAHEQGIIHRDIKSGNIQITGDGQAVIMDFGLARRRDISKLTQTGQTPGTVPYMSPEQATGEDVDRQTDIWSLGVVLYEMLSGKSPFPSEYAQAIIYSILNEDPEPLNELNQDIPRELANVVQKAMAKEKAERYQSAGELIKDLKAIRDRGKTAGSQAVDTQNSNEKTGFFTPAKTGVLLLAITGLLIAGYFFYSQGETSEVVEPRIAVLPFETLGSNQSSTFTMGIHGGLLTRLSNISGLKVTSRTSTLQYRENLKPIPEIAEELNVDWIVRGEVQETSDRVQVDARLVYAPEDRQVWANNYQRVLSANNLFEIQSELALEITGELETRLSADEKSRVERKPTENLNALRLFIEGMGLLEQRTPDAVLASVDYFMKAIEEDPEYAPAWAVLGEALIYIDFYKYDTMDNYSVTPREATDRALSLNPDLAEAHASQGILFYTQKRGTQAVEELERAIELQPSLETAQNWLGFVYLLVGEPEEAIIHAKRAIELNPLAPASHLYPSLSYLALGNEAEALREVRRAKEIQPEWGEIYAFEGVMLYHNQRYEEALEALARADSLIGREAQSVWLPDVATITALTRRALGQEMNSGGVSGEEASGINPFWIGIQQAARNDREAALASFNEIEQFSMWPNLSLRYYFPDILGPLRSDEQYREVLDRMNRQWE
ncbi:protein kinase [Balneolaceae bacterium YR4-1]|uniref:non-specific serine/threonine protein kinase n=1 Tax=Halalkalibaculum roseum TaxID=2709311 RepID=A0A6M1T5F1_9BACT|nr:serine/threonine-protein kinase [Halalkalibaculum roseum]NGP77997.1 protein kinase [Halalkalibaculum roseum]